MFAVCVLVIAGKSTLLVVLIVFLTRVLEIADRQCKIKIMIAALTNVAGTGAIATAPRGLMKRTGLADWRLFFALSLLFLLMSVDGILMGLQKLDVEFARVGSIKKVAPPILRSMIHMGTSASGSNSQQESEKTALADLRARLAEMDSNRDPDAPPCDPVNRW